jgi:hypothetical protein
MQCSCDKNGADLKGIKVIIIHFLLKRKWAAEAVADCYKRIENVNAKRLNSEC